MKNEYNIISKKKPHYPVRDFLREYLIEFHRRVKLPIEYNDLMRYENSFPLLDSEGKDTLWHSVSFTHADSAEIYRGLLEIYDLLTSTGNMESLKHLSVDRVDYCLFGNSHPFRIRIINRMNDNYDYYYIKKADASRIYGLELEHILSPNKINYFVCHDTLVEEHIMGIPGDRFLKRKITWREHNKVRMAKEFVKYNERVFVRLLGDMRDYNFVIDMTPDFDQMQYRIRSIDFDQQSYEGSIKMYLPQFFKENLPYVELSLKYLNEDTILQYQKEERALTARRVNLQLYQFEKLLKTMMKDTISTPEKVRQLAKSLNKHHQTNRFDNCQSMGDVVNINLSVSLGIPAVKN